MLHNCFLFPLPVQNSGLLCQPGPEGTQAAVRPQLSTDTVLRCSSVGRATRVREGGWRQHRPRLHYVWSVCFCANSAHQNHRPSSRRRGLRQPSVRGTCPLMLKYHKWPLCNVTYHHRMALCGLSWRHVIPLMTELDLYSFYQRMVDVFFELALFWCFCKSEAFDC